METMRIREVIRWRPSPRWLLVLVAVVTLVVWWCVSPLARGRVYQLLGLPGWALDATMQAPRSQARVRLLVRIMQTPVAEGVTFWQQLPVDEMEERGPWWSYLGPSGERAALLAAAWAETMRRPPSPAREATLRALWQTPVAAGAGLPDSPYGLDPWVQPFQQSRMGAWWYEEIDLRPVPAEYLADLHFWWLEPEPGTPTWVEHGVDGPLIEAVLPEWWATEEDRAARLRLARRFLSTPTLRHTHLWNALVRQDLIADLHRDTDHAILVEVWQELRAEPPSAARDAALGGLLLAEEKRNVALSTWSEWLAAEVQREPLPVSLPEWVRFGPSGPMVQRLLERADTWSLRTCNPWQPDGVEGLLDAGYRETMAWMAAHQRGLTMSESPFGGPLPGYPGGSRCVAAILDAVQERLDARHEGPVADLYLAVGLAAIELAHPAAAWQGGAWARRAQLVRQGHTPSLDWRDGVRCVVCGAGEPPALDVRGEEWSRPGSRCRAELGAIVRTLERWPWGVCARSTPVTLSPALEAELLEEWNLRAVDASHHHRAGPGGVTVASTVRARLRELLGDRPELTGALPEILARAGGLVAARAAGYLPSDCLPHGSIRALWRGHCPPRTTRSLLGGTCASCGMQGLSTPVVARQPDGSLTWVAPGGRTLRAFPPGRLIPPPGSPAPEKK